MKTLFAVAALSILSGPADPMQAENDRELDNLNTQLSEERVVPVFENGRPVGHKVLRRDLSVYEERALQNGDTITAPPTSEPSSEVREAEEVKQ